MPNDFNLQHAGAVIQKKWKGILLFTVLAGAVAAVTVFVVPQYFRGSATIASANPLLADKARLFNTQIQGLYSYFGSGDDLDRIEGIAQTDTVYQQLVNEFGLIAYYHLSDESQPLLERKAVLRLRRDIRYERTEQGHLRITAWTKQNTLSAALVNRLIALVSEKETAIWKNNYQQSLDNLNRSVNGMEQEYASVSDSINQYSNARRDLAAARQQVLLEQIRQYRKSAEEFSLASQTIPPVLYVLQPAVSAAKAERPDKPAVIIGACIAGFVFSVLVALINNRQTAPSHERVDAAI